MKGNMIYLIGGVIVMVAIGALAYILWSTSAFSEECQSKKLEGCESVEGIGFPLLLVALSIAGLVLLASTVVYILVTA